MPRARLASALFLALLVTGGAAWAGPDGDDGFDFGPPAGPRDATTEPPAPGEGSPGSAAPDPVAQEIAALATWPDRRGLLAAEALLLRGPDVLPRLLEALDGERPRVEPGAAWVLGRLGEPVHVVAILRAAARRRSASRAEVFFEAAWALDANRTKDWLFSFLPLPRAAFRAKATEFLAQHVGVEDHPRILRLLDAPKAEVRAAGLRLLHPAGVPDAEARLLQALSDPSPEVARTTTILLAIRADAALVARLNARAREGVARERAYAALALVEVSRAHATNPFEEATLSELAGRRGLYHPEKVVRGAAAVALAHGALDVSDESIRRLLDRTVVDVLIDTVGGEHFADFPSLREPVFSALRRLSGLDLPTTAPAWATWWRSQRDRFQARRPLAGIEPEDVPLARVRVQTVAADGRRRHVVYRSEDGTPAPGDYVLRRPAFEALVAALEEAGLFESASNAPPRADEHLLLTVGLLNQERSLVVTATDPQYALLAMRLRSLEEANRWQRYRDVDRWPDAAEWWRRNVDLMAEATPDARRAMLRAAIVYAYDDLPGDEARVEALDLLEDLDYAGGGAEGLTAAQVTALVSAAAAETVFGDLEARAVRFAQAQPAAARARSEIVEALAGRQEPAARDLLADLVAMGGPEEVQEAFVDPRPAMRSAATRAARLLLDRAEPADPESRLALAEAFRPGLEVLAGDEEPRVALGALVALGRMGAEGVVSRMEEIFKQGDLLVRIAVAEALGEVRAPEAQPLINFILAEERAEGSGRLRAAALKALARTGHANSVSLLVFYLLNDTDVGVQAAAAEALVDLASDEARFALVRALTEGQPDAIRRARLVDTLGRLEGEVVEEVLAAYVEDGDPNVAFVAAIRLAEHNVAASVPYLIELLRGGEPEEAHAALRALEGVTSTRFELSGFDVLAEQYERWHVQALATSSGIPDRAWFRDALRQRGYDVGPLTGYVAGESDPAAIPVLIRALRDEDAVLRRNAALALTRITGASFGDVDRSTSLRDAERVADRWARWWERVRGPSRDGRR